MIICDRAAYPPTTKLLPTHSQLLEGANQSQNLQIVLCVASIWRDCGSESQTKTSCRCSRSFFAPLFQLHISHQNKQLGPSAHIHEKYTVPSSPHNHCRQPCEKSSLSVCSWLSTPGGAEHLQCFAGG